MDEVLLFGDRGVSPSTRDNRGVVFSLSPVSPNLPVLLNVNHLSQFIKLLLVLERLSCTWLAAY